MITKHFICSSPLVATRSGLARGLRLYRRHLVDTALAVVRRPLADLRAGVVERARAHARAALAECLPVAGHHAASRLALGPQAAVAVVVEMLHDVAALGRRCASSLRFACTRG